MTVKWQCSKPSSFAMAEALRHNMTLQSFTMDACYTSLGDTSGVVMAEALRHNTTLQPFTMSASFTSLGDTSGVAISSNC